MIKVDNEKIILRGNPREIAAELVLLISYCQSDKRIDAEIKKIEMALEEKTESDDISHFMA